MHDPFKFQGWFLQTGVKERKVVLRSDIGTRETFFFVGSDVIYPKWLSVYLFPVSED